MRQLLFLLLTFCLIWQDASAQETVTVKSFTLTTDHIPGDLRRNDYNGTPCALVKVQVVDEITQVDGGKMYDIVNKGVEKWVYMVTGTRFMRVHLKNNLPIEVKFRDYGINELESNRVYQLVLNVPLDKKAEEAERQRKYEEQKRKDELRREELRLTQEQQRLEQERQKQLERQQNLQAQQQKLQEQRNAQDRQRNAQEQQRLAQEQQRLAQEQQRLDQERQRNAQEQQRLDLERQRNTQEQQRLDLEQQRNAQEQQRLDLEQQRIEQERRQQEEAAMLRQQKEEQQQKRHEEFMEKMRKKSEQSVVMGIEAGLNMAQAHFGNSSGNSSSVTGLRLGITAELRLAKSFYLHTGLLYSGKGYQYVNEKSSTDEKATAQFIDLPLLASLHLPLGNAMKMELNAGPYMALCIGGDVKDNWKEAQNYKKKFSSVYSSFDYGTQFGIGLLIAHHYRISLDYQLGLGGSYSNRNLMLGVGYRF